jgi:hypothetical protein
MAPLAVDQHTNALVSLLPPLARPDAAITSDAPENDPDELEECGLQWRLDSSAALLRESLWLSRIPVSWT